ncbi:uncharacterized protein [Dysidea avara]|uniref:uncharacterized protein isoform X2 n=1 Tax=Dysidea avara TaxID=196820 RepID=UPI00332D8C0B
MFTTFYLLLVAINLSLSQIDQDQMSKSLEHGRSQLETYQEQANKDECWRLAVSYLNETCSTISQSAQQRLAIAFANCHWLSAGRRSYECTEEMSISECTKDMSESAFDVYTQFYNHIEDACFYLQSQLWQEKTEKLIGDLSDTSQHAVEKITESLERHKILEKGQERSLSNQDQLIKGSQQLQDQLQSAREEVSSVFSNIQQQAWSFKEQFNEIFLSLSTGLDHIQFILTWLLGEFIILERIVVFIVGMVISYLLTCSKYTAGARPLIMVIIVVECLFVERQLVNWYLVGINVDTKYDIMESLHFVLWIARYTMVLLCLGVLVHCYMTYRNYEVVNYQLLNKIMEQNRQIKRHLKLETEEISEENWPVTSTPTQPVISQEAFIMPTPQHPTTITTTAGGVISAESGRHDQDSVDGDHPDSGLGEDNLFNRTTRCNSRYNFRKKCLHTDQLTRQGLHTPRVSSSSQGKRHSRRLSKDDST